VPNGRTTTLGYGHTHQQERKRLEPIVAQGLTVCTRHGHPQFPDCPGLIQPTHEWELGHDDTDKGAYTGPEHKTCNRRAGGLKRIGKLIPRGYQSHEW
jgi:hypothetical protein